ncbi:hypothetical protein P1059_00441 [Pasteurella multocida subsp. gallicida P1059]|nr:hypothetical protein P1059_00441 [Pasteurella multocida subsp. gallicida P1059]
MRAMSAFSLSLLSKHLCHLIYIVFYFNDEYSVHQRRPSQ